MRFLVDENIGPSVAAWLCEAGHDVFSVFDESKGMSDDQIIEKANSDSRVILTLDKDFGEKIYRDHKLHQGIILLRIADERKENKIRILIRFFQKYSHKIEGQFVVVTDNKVRFAPILRID